jgi:hypothetical protein
VAGGVEIEGRPPVPREQEIDSHYQMVTPDYFRAIGVPLVRGRWLAETDRDTAAPVVLVNESFVKRAFPNEDPIGKRISVAGEVMAPIVGIVKDYRHYTLPQPMGPATYYAFHTWPARTQVLALRTTRDDPASLIAVIRATVRDIDSRVAIYQAQTFERSRASGSMA